MSIIQSTYPTYAKTEAPGYYISVVEDTTGDDLSYEEGN